jgi:hypothetical protein
VSLGLDPLLLGSDLTGVSAPVSSHSGPSLFRCIVLGPCRCPSVSLHGSHRRSCSDVFDPLFTGDELVLRFNRQNLVELLLSVGPDEPSKHFRCVV